MIKRCSWAIHNELETQYHDTEWGIPTHDDAILFESLVLESMQAGLSWSTILSKRETMREAFNQFDYQVISRYDQEKINDLLEDTGVIRHRLKLQALVTNAQAFLAIRERFGTFDQFIWNYVDGQPIINSGPFPSQTNLSVQISKDLKKMGFKFLGPTTIYAFMQAIGMVNDHEVTCAFKKG